MFHCSRFPVTFNCPIKGAVSQDFKNYSRDFYAKSVFFVWPLMVSKYLYCFVIFLIENKVGINIYSRKSVLNLQTFFQKPRALEAIKQPL